MRRGDSEIAAATELVGGHNYCRNPTPETDSEPWCYTNDPRYVTGSTELRNDLIHRARLANE